MISLLNRFAWLLSIIGGITLSFVLLGDDYAYGFDKFLLLFVGIIFGIILKFVLLGRGLISTRVVEYTNKVVERTKGIDLKEAPSKSSKEPSYAAAESFKAESFVPLEEDIIDEDDSGDEEEASIPLNRTSIPSAPEEPGFIEKFFAENALAKIGGILLFLGVLFFLSLIFNQVGPIGKLVLGFMAGFAFYIIGVVLDSKGYSQESKTLLGVGILVNYLVILSGRYLIGTGNPIIGSDAAIFNGYTSTVLSEGTTFFFLILNTVFAIVTSLVYKSKTLLLFSFVFAFLNPFLIGANSDGTPYTLVGYGFIIASGALYLARSFYEENKDFARYLSFTGFIGGNLLFLLAPITTSGHWVLKLVAVALISLITILLAYKNNDKKNIATFFIGTYITFAFLLLGGSSAGILKASLAFVSYLLFLLIALGGSVFFLAFAGITSLGAIVFAPIILLFFLLMSGSLLMIVPVILGTLLAYLLAFFMIFENLTAWFRYVYFIVLGIFLMLTNFVIAFRPDFNLDITTHIATIISGLIFLIVSYVLSKRKGMEYLYSIGTVATVLLLSPVIETKGSLMNGSIIAIIIFAIACTITAFLNENIRKNDLKNLVLSNVIGIIFIAGELYNFGNIAKYFPGVSLGYAYAGLAAVYFILGYMMMQMLDFSLKDSAIKESSKNVVFTFLGISISLFSLAILLIFATRPAVVASIWFFESTILYFFCNRIKDKKIYIGAIILFIAGLIDYLKFIPSIQTKDFISLVPLFFVSCSFLLNLFFMKDSKDDERLAHDISHIIGFIMIGAGVSNIVPHTGQGFVFVSVVIIFAILMFFYDLFASKFLSNALLVAMAAFYLLHVFAISDIFWMLDQNERGILKFLQLAVTSVPGTILYLTRNSAGRLKKSRSVHINNYIIYLFIATTIYIYRFTDSNVFSITIYWALWAYFYLANGIKNDIQKRRTIGLYILTLDLAKILLYDIWFGINDALLRVVALMFVGGLMIYISMLYSKKYPGNLMKEFDISNLRNPGGSETEIENKEEKEEDDNNVVNDSIKDIEIGDYTSVIFELSNSKKYMIKSKNLIKIGILVTKKTSKNEFVPGELNNIYDFVLDNYKSELSESEFQKVTGAVKEFVEAGGKMRFM